MGCLATGCSWTNSIPPNELTVMCLNRGRENKRQGGGLGTDGERRERGKEAHKETEAERKKI